MPKKGFYKSKQKIRLANDVMRAIGCPREKPNLPYFSLRELALLKEWTHLTSDLSAEIREITLGKKYEKRWLRNI